MFYRSRQQKDNKKNISFGTYVTAVANAHMNVKADAAAIDVKK